MAGFIPDLTGAKLRGAKLLGADLSRANLTGTDLSEANLFRADLSDTNLTQAKLSEANLCEANLRQANLTGADLSGAQLWSANLAGATLSEAQLANARLFGTVFGLLDLSRAKGLDTCSHLGPSILDYSTLAQSGPLPISFLRGCGLPETFIEYLPSLLSHGIEFYSCFISYSHEDKAFARRLHDALQGRGIRCWLDEKQLLPGDNIYDQVDRGIRLWDKVLLCCSKHSLTSPWVDAEIEKAFEKEHALWKDREQKVLALIPLNLDGFLFEGWHDGKASKVRARLAPDFRGWDKDHARCEEQIDRIVRALRADGQAREKPPQSRL